LFRKVVFRKIKNGFNQIAWKFLPSCKEITALISRDLEKDLSWREKLAMKIHLYICTPCRRYLAQLKFMSEVLATQDEKLEKGEYETRLSSEASERLKEALKSSKFLILFALIFCY
jgi:hypothetical protein